MTRLTSRFLIDLLLRQTESAGGFATIIASGDAQSGVILIQCSDRGVAGSLLERRFSQAGTYVWEDVGATPGDGNSARAAKGLIPTFGSSNWTSQMRHNSSPSGHSLLDIVAPHNRWR